MNDRNLRTAVARAVFARPRNRESVVVYLRTHAEHFYTRRRASFQSCSDGSIDSDGWLGTLL